MLGMGLGLQKGGRLWSPLQITGLQYFWDASVLSSLDIIDGCVDKWRDLVKGVSADALDSDKRPAYRTGADGINGQPVVEGDGSDDVLKYDPANFSQPFAVFAVATVPTDAGTKTLLSTNLAGSDTGVIRYNGVTNKYGMRFNTEIQGTTDFTTRVGNAEFYLVLQGYDGTNSQLWINGVKEIDGIAGTDDFNVIGIFASWYPAKFCNSKIAIIGIVKTATGFISAADLANLETHVQSKFGLSW